MTAEPLLSTSSSRGRSTRDATHAKHTARCKRNLALLAAPAAVLLMAGMPFGFNSLFPVLYQVGAFRSSCEPSQRDRCDARTPEAQRSKCCDAQEARMVGMSSASLFVADAAVVVYGELLDRCGPPVTLAAAVTLQSIGLGAVALSPLTQSDALWFAGFILVGVSGPGVFLSALVFAERYTDAEALVTTLVAVAFDASSIVFNFWKLSYFGGASLASIALVSLALHLCVSALVYYVLPSRAELMRVRRASQNAAASRSTEHPLERADGTALDELTHDGDDDDTPPPPMYGPTSTICSLLLRTDTLLLLFFMSTANLNQSFYIETASDELPLLMPARASALLATFDFAFPILSVCTTPLVLLLLRRARGRPHIYFGFASSAVCVSMLLQCLPYEAAQYAAACLFGPSRTAQWACYFHFFEASDRYPPSSIGRLVGYGNLMVAILGDAPPYLFSAIVRNGGFPHTVLGRYVAIHASLTVTATFAAIALTSHLYMSGKARRRRHTLSRRGKGDGDADCGRVLAVASDSVHVN